MIDENLLYEVMNQMARDPDDLQITLQSDRMSASVVLLNGQTYSLTTNTAMYYAGSGSTAARYIRISPISGFIPVIKGKRASWDGGSSSEAWTDFSNQVTKESDKTYQFTIPNKGYMYEINAELTNAKLTFDVPIAITTFCIKLSDGTVKDVTSKLLNL